MKLKICGITNMEDLEFCTKYADAVGFIVEYPSSPRNVSIEKAKSLMKSVPPFVASVVVIPDFTKAMMIYSKLKPDIIQLHGQETVDDVKEFRERVDCKIIKACGVDDAYRFSRYADLILIDNKYSKLDLDRVNKLLDNLDKPVMLAGHLTPENVLDILEKTQPYAIDVCSGVEMKPGKKEMRRVKQFRKKLYLGKTVSEVIKNKTEFPVFKFYDKLSTNGLKLITEIKPASPIKGNLRDVSQGLERIVESMEQGGASALSVLVEKEKFGGSIELLKKVRELTHLPILAKGFFFSPKGIAEVAVAGADAFLLMTRVVEAQGGTTEELLNFGTSLGLDAVVEVGNDGELKDAVDSGARIVEINNRDIYGDLDIDLKNVVSGRFLPKGIVLISASGISSIEDIRRLYRLSRGRVDAFLVGTSVMETEDIRSKVHGLVKACEEVLR